MIIYVKIDGVLGIASNTYRDGSADAEWYIDGIHETGRLEPDEYVALEKVHGVAGDYKLQRFDELGDL